MDDAYLGGERNGGKRGRGSPGKTPIVAAVETTLQGQPIRLKFLRVKGFRCAEITALARHNFNPTSTVVTDGLRCFTGVSKAGCVHQPIITRSWDRYSTSGGSKASFGLQPALSRAPAHRRAALKVGRPPHSVLPRIDAGCPGSGKLATFVKVSPSSRKTSTSLSTKFAT